MEKTQTQGESFSSKWPIDTHSFSEQTLNHTSQNIEETLISNPFKSTAIYFHIQYLFNLTANKMDENMQNIFTLIGNKKDENIQNILCFGGYSSY